MALERGGQILTSYEDRIRLFSGNVAQPIIGDPSKPTGAAAFTLERNPLSDPVPMIPASQRITNRLFPAIGTLTNSIGKPWPIVIGAPGYNIAAVIGSRRSGDNVLASGFATPAYIVERDPTGLATAWEFHLLIAGHKVAATSVFVRDYQGNTATLPVHSGQTQSYSGLPQDMETYSYVKFTNAANGLVHPFLGASYATDAPEYWVQWGANGGAMENPFGSGYLTKAGDVMRWALSLCRVDVDHQAWQSYANLLNDFGEFAGYINDPELDGYTWAMDNILPFLPIEVVNGPDGLRPVYPFVFGAWQPGRVRAEITVDTGFYIVGPISTESEPDEILNRVELNYAQVAPEEHLGTYTLSGAGGAARLDFFNSTDEIAQLSRTRYGDRYEQIELQYVYDLSTAAHIARWLVRRAALTHRSLAFVADTSWGWLQIGDVVAITSDSYYFSNHKFQVIAKSWADGSWNFTMLIEENPVLNRRP